MPSYLGFNDTSTFRNYILGKTLTQTDGPQTFSEESYTYKNLSDYSNLDPGAVDTNRIEDLKTPAIKNVYKPTEFTIKENVETLSRRANLALYFNGTPYFNMGNHNLVSIMNTSKYETESELFKFAALNIRENKEGPVYARIAQNLQAATIGRVRLLDALQGNTATALNIITGKEPLIELNNKITVAKSAVGKGIDFLQTVTGFEFPFSEIPGDYLTNPKNPIENRPEAKTETGKIIQDVTGVLGSLIGIQRRPKLSRKPSDLFLEYMGQGQKQTLFDLLSYSTYAPNYTTSARSQQSSKIFSFVDQFAQGVKNVLGLEAPKGVAYIGDDRGNDVKFAMGDFNDRPVRSPFYLSLMFDSTQAVLFQRSKSSVDGEGTSGVLTWISKNSKNKLGINNSNYTDISGKFENTLSNRYTFRTDSILGYTQEILNTMPTDGGEAKSHIANVIDQTSRIFREGDVYLSRGSAIQYVDKYGEQSGVEYCRTWTKDRPYLTYSDTMKKGMNVRKFEGSVMTNPWNLNIAPMTKNKKDFVGSTNIFPQGNDGKNFYAKKYMFSIENLAWKTSNLPGFTVLDLPYCERGPNGGRVMWFPPYDLKINESNQARWEENTFLGRPEPIYTYQNTSRSGQISFKVVVDHPSILNLLVKEHFKNMSDEEADNYINAFFAGCEEIDFYELIKTYTTLTPNDVEVILAYINDGKNAQPTTITDTKGTLDQVVKDSPAEPNTSQTEETKEGKTIPISKSFRLNFEHDFPKPKQGTTASQTFGELYGIYKTQKSKYITSLTNEITTLLASNTTAAKGDKVKLLNTDTIQETSGTVISNQVTKITENFDTLDSRFNDYTGTTSTLKDDISGGTVQYITLKVNSSTSAVATSLYNRYLSMRRSYSVIKDVFTSISKDGSTMPPIIWTNQDEASKITPGEPIQVETEYELKDFGWTDSKGKIKVISINKGEEDPLCLNKDFKFVKDLDLHAPISFYCRASDIAIDYTKTEPPIIIPIPPPPPIIVPTPPPVVVPPRKKPNIDIVKKIIMKTLSECFYFQLLEEKSPVTFTSLKEKLKYFHPGFHSTTPEGLNARLTFLQQCIRPGDTIPIKGIADDNDINARNTSFGPPPVCVLRIGDFYNSKIIIRDVNFTYDDGVWDLNPEGIGVQPMIANVSLQVSFIGGHGLEKPVERLQNALSSNFYANTEIYDERSKSTNQNIDGKTSEQFTKAFLEDLQNRNVKSTAIVNQDNKITTEAYIGKINGNKLNYDELIAEVPKVIENYFKTYSSLYNNLNKNFGSLIIPMYLSEAYRQINSFEIYTTTSTTPGTTINLFGLSKKGSETQTLIQGSDGKSGFKKALETAIESFSPCEVMDFDKDISSTNVAKYDPVLKETIKRLLITSNDSEVKSTLDRMYDFSMGDFEMNRDKLIALLDKLNLIVKYGKDAKATKNKSGVEAQLLSFTDTDFYSKYSTYVDYIKDNTTKMYDNLDNTIDYNSPTISKNTYKELLKVLLNYSEAEIHSVFYGEVETATFNKLVKRLNKFITKEIKDVKFNFKKIKPLKNENPVEYEYTEADITDSDLNIDVNALNSSVVGVYDKLNYYKAPKK